jgi:hypothetical protein
MPVRVAAIAIERIESRLAGAKEDRTVTSAGSQPGAMNQIRVSCLVRNVLEISLDSGR